MIASLFLGAALAGAGTTTGAAAGTDEAAALIIEARDWLLNGDALPVDIDLRLQDLPPAERLHVIVFLRRSGLLSDPGRSADWILAPTRSDGGSR